MSDVEKNIGTHKPEFDGEWIRLGDVCEIVMGQSPDSSSYNTDCEGLPFYQGNADFGETHPTPRTWCSEPKKVAEPGDILISVRAPVGAINVADERCCIGRGLAAVRSNGAGISNAFLALILQSKRAYLDSMSTGSTFKAIGKKVLSSCEMPLYSREVQSRIACQVNWIDDCLRSSRRQLSALDDLVKSQFVEMFGDGEWTSKTIGELATDIRYGTSKKATECGKYTYLRMNNLTDDGKLVYDDVKYIDLSGDELEKCQVVDGDLLFNRTNSREKVGKTAVFHGDTSMVIAGYIIRVRLGEEMRSDYLSVFMNLSTTKAMLRSIAKGAVHQANINSKELATIKVPVAPIELQDRFLDFVARVDKLGFDCCREIVCCGVLFSSMSASLLCT